jgi:hypothetical protein
MTAVMAMRDCDSHTCVESKDSLARVDSREPEATFLQ